MTNMYLNQTTGSYCYGKSKVSVSGDVDYSLCKLFKRYKHDITPPTTLNESICICKGSSTESAEDGETCQEPETCKNGGEKLILKVDSQYTSAKLERVDVYFNQYDLNNPLLFVLNFQSNGGSPENKYYKMSSFDNDKASGKEISGLPKYSEYNDIVQPLLDENDKLQDFLTFDIGKTSTSTTSGGASYHPYNNSKIKLTDDSGSDTQLGSNGFKRYKHTPFGNGDRKYGCVIYNRNVLMKKEGDDINIQNQRYSTVNVYFGDKEKRTNGGTRDSDLPLLIELNKNGSGPDYYVHKKDSSNSKYYWESLSGDSNGTLKNLLEDIGLNTDPSGRGHETLKSLLEQVSLKNGGDLAEKLKKATGSKLKDLLDQKVNGQKSLLVVLLARVEFNLVDSVVILVERKEIGHGKYGEGEISHAVGNLEPKREINRIKNEVEEIVLKDKTNQNFNCVKDLNYKVMEHDFSKYVEKLNPSGQEWAGLRFLIPAANKGEQYKELSLYSASPTGPENLVYKYYQKSGSSESKVYVVFYESDKRPLMICYGTDAFVPKGKGEYDSEWVKASGIEKFVCEGTDERQNEQLIKALTEVVGFLNPVDLSKHPNGTSGKECNAGSADGTPITCTATGQGTSSSCTYPVHRYNNQEIKVSVKCEDLPSTPPGTGSCYKKLIHVPIGTNGEGNGDKFRLGNIVYNRNGGAKPQGSIEYYPSSTSNGPNKSEHWRKPLIRVEAYFYDEDKCYEDPLLVVLEFANGSGTNDKECYKLKASGPSMAWEKDDQAGDKVEKNGKCLVEYLDEIRYGIKKVLQIKLECKGGEYPAMGRAASAGTGFEPLQNGDSQQIQVAECEKTCEKLKESNYKCYQHQISTIGSGFDYNSIGGVAFTIPSDNGEDNVIQLYKNGSTVGTCTNGQTGEEIKPLTYNKCMGDIYVFFYNMGTSVDSVPLMLWYNHNYYKPCNRESYFTRWDKVPELSKVGKPCESDATQLAAQLDIVNRELNRIDLDKSGTAIRAGQGSGSYGLPETVEVGSSKVNVNTEVFKIERVSLTKQEGPKQPSPPTQPAYVKIVHRTVNGYTIGKITSNKGENELTKQGFCINGTGGDEAIITVKNGTNGNHKDLVAVKKWNTVVAYYSSNDCEYKLPQLIVILKTNDVGNPVTSVKGTGYGYYILTNNGTNNYEYKWVEVKNGSQVTLDDATDFRLLNSVVILLEQRPNNGGTDKYDEEQISSAIKSAQLTSPGQEVGEINRLKGKDKTIKVTDATTESEGKCLQKYGYKLFKHDFSNLVEIGDPLKGKLPGVNLIAGLRFLIPTSDSKEYKELRLYDRGKRVIYYQKEKNSIYVYFYGSDPRPLMLCYGGSAYRPMYMITYFYFKEWVEETNVTDFKCLCDADCTQCDKLIVKLVEVSDFLNPVQIHQNNGKETTYEVHEFKGQKITIKVESVEAKGSFCYHRYTHTPEKSGFRLGNIEYNGRCIEDISTNNGAGKTNGKCITSALNGQPDCKYKTADKVVVFYYQGDTKLERPLLVALCKNGDINSCEVYYELQNDGGSSGAKLYSKGKERSINVNDTTPNGTLDSILGRILSENNNKLQIIIDKRPMETLYCFKPGEKNGQPDICKKNNNICDKSDYIY